MKLVDLLQETLQEPNGGGSSGRLVFVGSAVVVMVVWAGVSLVILGSMVYQKLDVSAFKFPTVPIEILSIILGSGAFKVVQRIKGENSGAPDAPSAPTTVVPVPAVVAKPA